MQTRHKSRQILTILLALAMLALTVNFSLGAQSQTEYQRYVHNCYSDGVGNWTYVEKPLFPVLIANNSLPIGNNWTIVCPLSAFHSYHVYCYGAWVNTGADPKTDFDIYVYNPQGTLESLHTEAAGLPEHLGTTVDAPFFVPKQSGNYTFMLVNDARESHGAQQATFMIIENIECDKWYSHSVMGKSGSIPAFSTSWAYEFLSNASKIEIYVNVPSALDMYEVRLYLMSDSKSLSINGVPLAWEMGLYGNGTGLGGYNMESEGYRGVAYASCEYLGQDMQLNYTTASSEMKLYHLVLMGESGEGTVDFMVKTSFEGRLSPLTFPKKVTPNDETAIAYAANTAPLESATLQYTINDWVNTSQIRMLCSNRTASATIPKQAAGSLVKYSMNALDTLKNVLNATGQFTVKDNSEIANFNATKNTIVLGSNITVTGTVSTQAPNATLQVQFMSSNETKNVDCTTFGNGTFTVQFQPQTAGIWTAQAFFKGNDKVYESESAIILVTVNEPTFVQKNGLYIGAGFIAAVSAAGAVLYVKKYRGN
jgi:hypothetical protein